MAWITGSASRTVPEAADRAVGLARRTDDGRRDRPASGRIREALDGGLAADLRTLLSRVEVHATTRRVDALLAEARFPLPSPTWPAVPWPPF